MKARSSTGSTADLEADDLDLEDGDDLDQEVAAASALFRRRHHASSSPSSGTSSSSNYHRSGAGSSLESQVIGQIIGGETGWKRMEGETL